MKPTTTDGSNHTLILVSTKSTTDNIHSSSSHLRAQRLNGGLDVDDVNKKSNMSWRRECQSKKGKLNKYRSKNKKEKKIIAK